MPTAPLTRSSSAADIRVFAPPIEQLARHWPTLEPILKRATDTSRSYEPIDLLQLALLGRMTLWMVTADDRIVAAASTEVRQLPRNRVLEVSFVAGDGVRDWYQPMLDAFDAHATAAGCTDILAAGRTGWLRCGFKKIGLMLERRIVE